MKRVVNLALYGPLDYTLDDDLGWRLLQSRSFSRLRDISLDSVPHRFVPHSVPVTRGQHSVAVAHLARTLCDEVDPDFAPYRQTLIAAALLHDTGSPAFSHLAEPFLHALTGRSHEQQAAVALQAGGEVDAILRAYEVDPAEVLAFITGTHPLPLIAGSIDLDNIDNSIHLLLSLGEPVADYYQPLRLIKSFRLRDGHLALDTGDLQSLLGWQDARATLYYDILYSDTHLAASALLYRAIEFALAEGAIGEDFFALDESSALTVLRRECGEPTRTLVETLVNWRHYPCVYRQPSREVDPRLTLLYDDWELRRRFTDALAYGLGIDPGRFALQLGPMRGPKKLDLPFVGPHAQAAPALFPGQPARQLLAVFAPAEEAPRQSVVTHAIEVALDCVAADAIAAA